MAELEAERRQKAAAERFKMQNGMESSAATRLLEEEERKRKAEEEKKVEKEEAKKFAKDQELAAKTRASIKKQQKAEAEELRQEVRSKIVQKIQEVIRHEEETANKVDVPEKEEEFDQELYDSLLQEAYRDSAAEEQKKKAAIDEQHQAKLDALDVEAESKTGGDDEGDASSVSGITPPSDFGHEESKASGASSAKKKPIEFKPVMKMLKNKKLQAGK